MSTGSRSTVGDEMLSTRDSSTQSGSSQSESSASETNSTSLSQTPQTSAFNTSSNQSGSVNSIMNFIYPTYQTPLNLGSEQSTTTSSVIGAINPLTNQTENTTSLSVAAAISGASATLASSENEPEMKKVKLAHFNFFKNQLFADSLKREQNMMPNQGNYMPGMSGKNSQSLYLNHKKLEERIGGILCCTVCLDLPSTAIYQVSYLK
jgi:hypothetical protein